jgi:hypothetical protein
LGAVEKFPQKRRRKDAYNLTSFHASDSMPRGGDSRKPSQLFAQTIVKKEDCPKLQKGKRLQFFTKKKKKRKKKNGDRTGVRRMQIKNANTRNALRTNFCFLWRNNRTKKQKGQTNKQTKQQQQHKGGCTRSGALLTWQLPRHGIANLASQSWVFTPGDSPRGQSGRTRGVLRSCVLLTGP